MMGGGERGGKPEILKKKCILHTKKKTLKQKLRRVGQEDVDPRTRLVALGRGEVLGESEVREHGVALSRHEHVLRLQVPVNDSYPRNVAQAHHFANNDTKYKGNFSHFSIKKNKKIKHKNNIYIFLNNKR